MINHKVFFKKNNISLSHLRQKQYCFLEENYGDIITSNLMPYLMHHIMIFGYTSKAQKLINRVKSR